MEPFRDSKSSLPWWFYYRRRAESFYARGVEEKAPLDEMVGRKTPASGVKISLDGPTIVFLTVNAKDRVPWIAQEAVQRTLEQV